MVHDQSPRTLVPGVCALYNPTFSQHNEPVGICLDRKQVALVWMRPAPDILVGRMANYLDLYVVALGDGLGALPGIARVSEKYRYARVFLHR